jgi:hypothetical protein
MKKGICSLSVLTDCLKSANKRYIEFISGFDNRNAGRSKLEKITESKVENNGNYKGFNFFSKKDLNVLLAVLQGQFNIGGFRNRQIQQLLKMTSAQVSRLLKRLTVHGLIKKLKILINIASLNLVKKLLLWDRKLKNQS